MFGRDRESAVVALLATYLAVKFYVSATWELFCSFLFLYGKCACIVLFCMTNVKGAAYYAILCFIFWLVLSHPKYTEASKIVKAKSMSHLAELLDVPEDELMQITREKRGKKVKADHSKITTTVLLFTASWADQCYFTYPLWVRFANRFSTDKVQFIECDASRFEKLCH